mmetsp:Transcript_21335/g.50715  ORF Transcript_21335/g.50715 Transcript_21335/m.50715 type:complete len:201 (-) Transcript_21335:1032-1634(-)
MPDDDRKARLKALAARAGRTKQPVEGAADATNDDVDEGSKKKPALKFRNYAPQDENLDAAGTNGDGLENNDASSSHQPASKKPRIDSGGDGEGNEGGAAKSSKMALQEALQEAQIEMKVTSNTNATATATTGTGTVDVKSVAPQKVDADLKRGIADKLAKLERRTQRCIVEMLKERLELEAEREVGGEDDDDDGGGSDLD